MACEEPIVQESAIEQQPEYIAISAPMTQLCEPNIARYAMNCVRFVPSESGGFLTATNGRAAAVVECEATMKASANIPKRVIPSRIPQPGLMKRQWRVTREGDKWFGEKHEKNRTGDDTLLASKAVDNRKFPNIASVLPTIPDDGISFVIDVRQLERIAAALRTDGKPYLRLIVTKDAPSLIVIGGNGVGVLMKCTDEGTGSPPADNEKYETIRRKFAEAVAKGV